VNTSSHGLNVRAFPAIRKARCWHRGMVLIESMLALSILTLVGLTLLKLNRVEGAFLKKNLL
jgi:hypothetical protein